MSKNKQTVAVTHHTNYLIVHPPSQQSDYPQTHPHWEMVRPVKIGRNWCNTALVCRAVGLPAPHHQQQRRAVSYCRTAGGGDELDTGLILFIFFMEMTVGPIRDFTSPLATSAAFADNPTCKSSLSIETSFWNLN